MKPLLIVKRFPYEEPYLLHLEFAAANGSFGGSTDVYWNVEDLKEIGKALQNFPRKIGDEYRDEYGSENPEKRCYRYFLIRAYTTDSVGHCAIQFIVRFLGGLKPSPLGDGFSMCAGPRRSCKMRRHERLPARRAHDI